MYRLDVHDARKLIETTTVIVVGVSVVFLGTQALLVRFTEHIAAHPGSFLSELAFVSIVASVPIYYVAYVRSSSYKRATLSFAVLTLKIAAFWVLMELAGVNSFLFPARASSV
jgi:hypothetical protein